ncbi:MAG TPA: helix-turn-helix domain-containing protein [Actinomycetota bacterium]|nr:helix-turn-helix domain-containing protein [Actinomycetota bacterium]
MSVKGWQKKVLKAPGAAARVAEIEDELRLAAGLTALREQAGYSQRDLARRMGISQPRVAAIEQSRNVTIEVLEQYVDAVGGKLEVSVVKGRSKIPLISAKGRRRVTGVSGIHSTKARSVAGTRARARRAGAQPRRANDFGSRARGPTAG